MKKQAFTLIEVIVAIGIFVMTILGIISFFGYSAQVNRFSKNITVASNLAQATIDENISKSYDQITVGNGTRTRFSADQADPYYGYEKKVDVTYVDQNLNAAGTNTGLIKIVCTIYWFEGASEKNVQVATLKSDF